MVTIPPRPAEPSAPEPHQARAIAESFGADPDRYDRVRPRYPDALVARIVAASPGRDVVDAGCGTGIVARQFQQAGCQVLGVEVDPRMARWTRQHRGLEVEESAFEVWKPAGRVFDAVVSGQAWHWVDPVAGAAKAAEALRQDGRLAVFWNYGQPPPAVAEAFAAIYARLLPDSLAARGWSAPAGDRYGSLCTRAADAIAEAGTFSAAEQWRFDWEQTYTAAQWLDHIQSTGGHAGASAEPIAQVLAEIGNAIDNRGGSFLMHYTTVVVTAVRTAPPTTTAPAATTAPPATTEPPTTTEPPATTVPPATTAPTTVWSCGGE